jgi:thiamine transporter ThiT
MREKLAGVVAVVAMYLVLAAVPVDLLSRFMREGRWALVALPGNVLLLLVALGWAVAVVGDLLWGLLDPVRGKLKEAAIAGFYVTRVVAGAIALLMVYVIAENLLGPFGS